MKTSRDPRHARRVKLVQHLFSAQFQKKPDATIKHIWDHLAKIDALIIQIAPERPLEKLNVIDLAILRLAIYELTIDKTQPFKVIIDEAIEIAKEFGGEASGSFVNGALGKIANQL